MPETQHVCKGISNPAKILRGYIEATGISDARILSERLEIPLRTIQRLKLEVAAAVEDASAKDARHGATDAPKTPNAPYMALPKTPDMALAQELHSCAGATKELPTEVVITKIEEISLSETGVSDPCDKPAPKAKRRHSYTHAFEEFWKAYPDTTNNSKPEAFKQWRMLTSAEQVNATDGLRHLRAICQKQPDYRCVHACRYLSQRRWESYPSTADRLGVNVVPITGYKLNPVPRREVSQAELEAMVLADEAREAARV